MLHVPHVLAFTLAPHSRHLHWVRLERDVLTPAGAPPAGVPPAAVATAAAASVAVSSSRPERNTSLPFFRCHGASQVPVRPGTRIFLGTRFFLITCRLCRAMYTLVHGKVSIVRGV